MSISSLMGIGTRAMFAASAALQTTGNNISNASTPGYSRQQADFATAGGQYTGSGYFGQGVNVATIERAHSDFLTHNAVGALTAAQSDQARSDQLQQLQKVFPTGEDGIGYASGEFLNAFDDVAARPQDLSARQVVLSRADDVATRFRQAGTQLDALQAGVSQDIQGGLAEVNSLAQQVATINMQIAGTQGSGHTPNDLLDQRDHLISQISEHIAVTTIPASDGSLGVFIGGGQRLVLGGEATKLAAVTDPFRADVLHVGVVEGGASRALPDDSITGGSLSGLLRFQSDDLVDARNQLGQMASALASRVNQQQSFGLDLRQPASAGGPMFSVGAPQAVPASTNALDVNGTPLASVALTVTDASALQASDYQLSVDASGAPGTYTLTRLSDGTSRSVVTGDVVDGMRIDVTGTPGAKDRFLLRPVAAAASAMKSELQDPRGLAAAAPVTASVGAANTGTATVDALRVASTSFDPSLKASVSFTSSTGDYTWTLNDAATNAVVSTGTATWTAGQPIVLNGFELKLAGVPAQGDTIAVSPTAFPAANNGNAKAMADIRDDTMVGRGVLANGATTPGQTMTDAYAGALADIGVRTQSAMTAAKISQGVSDDAELARSNQSGVNLDEEAARLIQYQQSYQAAAKVLQVAQTLFDTMLQAASGR